LLDQSLDYAKRAREEGKNSGHPATFCRSLALVIPVFLTTADVRQSDQYIGELRSLRRALSDPVSRHSDWPEGSMVAPSKQSQRWNPLLLGGEQAVYVNASKSIID
jgi:hypothetical protein